MHSIPNGCGIKYKVVNDKNNNIIISGEFKIRENENYGLNDELHSAIIMVVTTPTSFYSFNPFQDIIIFSDDVDVKNGFISSGFNVNFSEVVSGMKDVRFNVLITLGDYMSNIEKITIN